MTDYLKQTDPLVKRWAKRTSTALDYFLASRLDNEASKQIDDGNEPFLLNKYAYNIGTHPYVEVWDVGIELRGGNVVLITAKGEVEVTPDTILVWK
jgi:hypothetical protein